MILNKVMTTWLAVFYHTTIFIYIYETIAYTPKYFCVIEKILRFFSKNMFV